MKPIPYLDRATNTFREEKVYGGKTLSFLYGKNWVGRFFLYLIAHFPFASRFMGFWNKRSASKKKVPHFIEEYGIDSQEFLEPVAHFKSFNDFFIRKLRPESRPIDQNPKSAIIPADARYWFFEDVDLATPFQVKKQSLNLEQLFQNRSLAKEYEGASLVLARLCPSDYHRFHFPCDGIPTKPQLINGLLYSVNPIALKQNLSILCENKRMLTFLNTKRFEKIAYFEIGATSVGTIVETFTPEEPVLKGDEKGYFSFGASSLILLFKKGTIHFSQDLLEASRNGIEIRCLFGQELGTQLTHPLTSKLS